MSSDNTLLIPFPTGDVSDGYHTFNELYDHRCLLWINLCLSHPDNCFKTNRDDKGSVWPGWFILGMNTQHGMMTYHIPVQYWQLLDSIKEIESNKDYDGHTSDDVLDRLLKLAENING